MTYSNRPCAGSAAFYHSFPINSEWNPRHAGNSTSSGSFFPSQARQGAALNTNPEIESEALEEARGSYNNLSQNSQGPSPRLDTQFSQLSELPIQQSEVSENAQGYMIDEDDDPFDVSDDDIPMEEYVDSATWGDDFLDHVKSNDLCIVVALQAGQESRGQQLRSFTTFIDRPDMLATYVPSPQSSPLSDSMTARIFCHFVNVTAPCISLFERHPANPSLIFQGQPVPASQQHIWTCE